MIIESKLRARRFHYVAPSIWAYKHHKDKKFDALAALVDHLFILLPFEKLLLDNATSTKSTKEWCTFVGHPSIEEFLERHNAFDTTCTAVVDTSVNENSSQVMVSKGMNDLKALSSGSLLKDFIQAQDTEMLHQKSAKFYELIKNTRMQHLTSSSFREKHGIKPQAFVVCALVGSRVNEVKRSLPIVQEAFKKLSTQGKQKPVQKDICVIFPTLSSVASLVEEFFHDTNSSYRSIVLKDLTNEQKLEVFQSANLAIATSGTIVMETCLASLPTIVIYKANKITEWIAKALANVQYVSLPNLLMGFPFVPELLFSQCTSQRLYQLVKLVLYLSIYFEVSIERDHYLLLYFI
jgi:lipid-A-disaccharide synthase